jgi:hypothetical protein
MTSHIDAQETINTARAWIAAAVRIDEGRSGLEADAESAYLYLEEATMALGQGDVTSARHIVQEAIDSLHAHMDLLTDRESREKLETAVGYLRGLHWDAP